MKCFWCGRFRDCSTSEDMLAYVQAIGILWRQVPWIGSEQCAQPERGEEGGES